MKWEDLTEVCNHFLCLSQQSSTSGSALLPGMSSFTWFHGWLSPRAAEGSPTGWIPTGAVPDVLTQLFASAGALEVLHTGGKTGIQILLMCTLTMALPATSRANLSVLISGGKAKTGPNHDLLSTETQL